MNAQSILQQRKVKCYKVFAEGRTVGSKPVQEA